MKDNMDGKMKLTDDQLAGVTGGSAGDSDSEPTINENECIGCGVCQAVCPTETIVYTGLVYRIDPSKCIICGECKGVCPVGAIR